MTPDEGNKARPLELVGEGPFPTALDDLEHLGLARSHRHYQTTTVRELVELAFGHVGLDAQEYVHTDPKLLRPAEVNKLCGNAAKAHTELGWRPEVDFPTLVRMMVDADLQRVERELHEKNRTK